MLMTCAACECTNQFGFGKVSLQSRDSNKRACKSRGLVFILKTSGALRLSLRYFNIGIPIQKVKFVFEDVVDEQFAELSKKNY